MPSDEDGGMEINMEINALLMGEKDNVVTCVNDIASGSVVTYRKGEEVFTLVAIENIPYCHKIAIADIPGGEHVIKYNESLGIVSGDIKKGQLVAHHNLFSVPRDYDSEMIPL